MNPEEAITIIARHAIWSVTRDQITWAEYPDISQDDWNRVIDEIDQQVNAVAINHKRYQTAYELLTGRELDQP